MVEEAKKRLREVAKRIADNGKASTLADVMEMDGLLYQLAVSAHADGSHKQGDQARLMRRILRGAMATMLPKEIQDVAKDVLKEKW